MTHALRRILSYLRRQTASEEEELEEQREEAADAWEAFAEAQRLWYYAPEGSKAYYAQLVQARREALHALRSRNGSVGSSGEHRSAIR